MKLSEIKQEIRKYQYLEDTDLIDAVIAAGIANRMKFGDPVWLIVIGASSGGKSQILRPIAVSDVNFVHRIDDLTENTFLSGAKSKAGEENSLLIRMGTHGIIVISDLTVLMSKGGEARATILSQFRMIYDGEMIKHSGSSAKPIEWKGYMGIVAGSTPSIYSSFEEVSDMGERFVYYRMKEFDASKATHLALSRGKYGRELDEELAKLYGDYTRAVVKMQKQNPDFELSESVKLRIIEVASFAERVRTTAHMDFKGEVIVRIPTPAFPMRVALQLMSIAKGLATMRKYEGREDMSLDESDLRIIDWVGWSLANEEKRACLRILASVAFDGSLNTATVADKIGLDTRIIGLVLQNLSAVGVLERNGSDGSLTWTFKKENDWKLVRRIEGIEDIALITNRETTQDDGYHAAEQEALLEGWGQ